MKKARPNQQVLKVGDLVYHLLYGREWVGVILEFGSAEILISNEVTLVHMQPGTEHESFFKKSITKYRVSDKAGYVSHHWLRLLEEPSNKKRK
jgi:hypothetical protein